MARRAGSRDPIPACHSYGGSVRDRHEVPDDVVVVHRPQDLGGDVGPGDPVSAVDMAVERAAVAARAAVHGLLPRGA